MANLRVGSVIKRGVSVYVRNFVPFTLLVALTCFPLLLYTLSIVDNPVDDDAIVVWTVVMIFGGLAFGLFATATVAYGSFNQLRGQHASAIQSFVMGLKRLLPVLGVGLMIMLLVLLSLGAFVIPGVGLYCTYVVAVPVAVVEGSGVGASMSRSDKLTMGHRLKILVILILLTLFNSGFAVVLQSVFESSPKSFVVVFYVETTLAIALNAVMTTVIYHDLRSTREGATVEDIASVFD